MQPVKNDFFEIDEYIFRNMGTDQLLYVCSSYVANEFALKCHWRTSAKLRVDLDIKVFGEVVNVCRKSR